MAPYQSLKHSDDEMELGAALGTRRRGQGEVVGSTALLRTAKTYGVWVVAVLLLLHSVRLRPTPLLVPVIADAKSSSSAARRHFPDEKTKNATIRTHPSAVRSFHSYLASDRTEHLSLSR
jgi:hypothetical protein